MPDSELLLTPLQNREAQRSSSLEGTITDPRQQALFKVDPKIPVSDADPVNAYREVFNYAQALRYHQETKKKLPLSLRLVRSLHEVLLQGVRGAAYNPGQFRRMQNQVGKPARYVPPTLEEMPEALYGFERYLHEEPVFDPLVQAFLVHYQFEAIHPFSDGNGRVGRLLLAITVTEWCGLSDQWLYMSPYFERNKDRYIDLLLKVSTHGAWEEWIEFCLEGVVAEAGETEVRCERLVALNWKFHDKANAISGGSVRLSSIVDRLFETPVVSVTQVQRDYGVSYPTARSDLRKLNKARMIQILPETPRITYYCRPIIDITHEDS